MIEVKQSPWGMRLLWSAKQAVKLTIPVVDTVLMGADITWLFTTKKQTEVKKKKLCSREEVHRRFIGLMRGRLGDQRRCAVLRFDEGRIKVLEADALMATLEPWPQSEPGLKALQAFLPSGTGPSGSLFYRTRFRVADARGLVVTSAFSLHLFSPKAPCHDGVVGGNVGSAASRSKILSPLLNARLDKATATVVRYIEGASPFRCRVLDIECDFIEDRKGTLWLSWIGDATVATGKSALELKLAGMDEHALSGRDGFLPVEYRRLLESKQRDEIEAKRRVRGSESGEQTTRKAQERRGSVAAKLEEVVLASQLMAAAEVNSAVDDKELKDVLLKQKEEANGSCLSDSVVDDFEDTSRHFSLRGRSSLKGSAGEDVGMLSRLATLPGANSGGASFPSPTRSVGDLNRLGVQVEEPQVLSLDSHGSPQREEINDEQVPLIHDLREEAEARRRRSLLRLKKTPSTHSNKHWAPPVTPPKPAISQIAFQSVLKSRRMQALKLSTSSEDTGNKPKHEKAAAVVAAAGGGDSKKSGLFGGDCSEDNAVSEQKDAVVGTQQPPRQFLGLSRATAPTESWGNRQAWAGNVSFAWHKHAKGAGDLYRTVGVTAQEAAVYELFSRARKRAAAVGTRKPPQSNGASAAQQRPRRRPASATW